MNENIVVIQRTTEVAMPILGWHRWGASMSRTYLRGRVDGPRIPLGWEIVRRTDNPADHLRLAWAAPLPLSRVDAEAAAEIIPNPEDYAVVIREIPEGGRWTVGLGVGQRSASRNLKGSYATRREAGLAGIIEARRQYDQEVESIRDHIRGGSLDWGVPFPLTLDKVSVLIPAKGESAWAILQDAEGAP